MDTLSDAERLRLRDERIPPREVELIKFRDNRTPLVIKLVTGETLEGAVRWYDDRALRVVQSDRSEMTIYFHAIAYYKARS